ncbi:consensus disorder prediction [Desulfoluna spongiiphila]|nr:consensus disorder prediction [Desulfoluna spongiiphila]
MHSPRHRIVCLFFLLCMLLTSPLHALDIPSPEPTGVADHTPEQNGGFSQSKKTSPWSWGIGVDVSGYGAESTSTYGGEAYDLSVRHGISPMVQVAYRMNGNWDLEGGVRHDWMRWKLSPSLGPDDGSVRALTLALGAARHGAERTVPVLGAIRPLSSAALLWRFIDADLDGPAMDYRSGPGVEFAAGFTRDYWGLRAGLSYTHHDVSDVIAGATAEDLELLGAFVRFTLFLGR